MSLLRDSSVGFFSRVPDSLLKSFCAHVTDKCGEDYVIASNEGGVVGLVAGKLTLTGK